MRIRKAIIPLTLALALLAGCTGGKEAAYIDPVPLEAVELTEEAVALADAPAAAVHDLLLPEAPGRRVARNERAVIDYSNTGDGYVMVCFTAQSDRRLKAKVTGPVTEGGYQYNLTQGQWTTLPLSDGDGTYKVSVYEHTGEGKKYAVVTSATFRVTLKDEFAPFLRPNQYVDYADAADTVAKAAELTAGITDPLEKVEKVYDFVVNTLTYDRPKAKTVQTGYLPRLDNVLTEQKGICFDYAALMAAMLRCQDIPCKLVVGYAGEDYHAWISVWTEETGWVDGAIYFDGTSWQRMDPTFASSGKRSDAIMEYIGDGENYTAMYLY